MTWKIKYLKSAQKSFRKIDPQARQKIRHYLEVRLLSLDDPRQAGKPLKGELAEFWRYRVGDYRIICELHDETLTVLVVQVGQHQSIF